MGIELASISLCAGPLCLGRPGWLLALLPGFWLLLRYWRQQRRADAWRELISARLLPHLLRTDSRRSRRPLLLALASLLSVVLALAGPRWMPASDHTEAELPPLVILLDLSAAMQSGDNPNTPLARARLKLRDLLQSRAGAATALLVFAGSAHTVVPLTEDVETLDWYLQELGPSLMPRPGYDPSQALTLVEQLGVPPETALLLVSDQLQADEALRTQLQRAGRSLVVLRLDAMQAVSRAMPWSRVKEVAATLDNRDLEQVQGYLNQYQWRHSAVDPSASGYDLGYPLVFLVALVMLGWFRPGMVMRWR
ncbi:VWA domain-containing protein [Motiliproteus coralliicola]|uniref:VWA domain-containing protein n=1 Tax=Motiliproteus coralliicola TaxID=2283196 RepID=A0A369WTC3_9GAMM|nr:VWA domain-containing protein [Motiliproteus coralliicola]RDE24393.1 VWA domain-containing protein [Motiliproteus coralliicola]